MSSGVDNKRGEASKSSSSLTGRVHRTAQDLQRTIENLSVDGIMDGVAGEAVGSGYRGNATHAAHRQAGSANKREEERRKFTRAMVRAMKELNDLYDRRNQLDNEIKQHQRNADTAQEMIDDIRAGKEIEVNDDGTLKNEEYERLRREYEERTGKKLDPSDTDAFLQALLDQRDFDRRQIGLKKKQRDDVDRKIDEADPEVRDMVENGRQAELEAYVDGMDTHTFGGLVANFEAEEDRTHVREAAGLRADNIERLAESDQSGSVGKEFSFGNTISDEAKPPFDYASSTSVAKVVSAETAGEHQLSIKFNKEASGAEMAPDDPAPQVATEPDFNPFRAG